MNIEKSPRVDSDLDLILFFGEEDDEEATELEIGKLFQSRVEESLNGKIKIHDYYENDCTPIAYLEAVIEVKQMRLQAWNFNPDSFYFVGSVETLGRIYSEQEVNEILHDIARSREMEEQRKQWMERVSDKIKDLRK